MYWFKAEKYQHLHRNSSRHLQHGEAGSDLARGGSEADPAVVQGHDRLPPKQLDADLSSAEHHQRVHRRHAAVTEEHAAGLYLLVVHQVGAVVMPDLERRRAVTARSLSQTPWPLCDIPNASSS